MKVTKVSGTFNQKGVLLDTDFNSDHKVLAIVDYAELLEFLASAGLKVEVTRNE